MGSDDLTIAWDFGDGTAGSATYYNDGLGPDQFPSPEMNPITARGVAEHGYLAAGAYSVSLVVTDDDGGTISMTFIMTVGS